MSENNNKKNDDKTEEIEKLFNEIKENGNLSDDDLNELKKSLDSLMKDDSVGSLFFKFIKRLLVLFISIYVISTAGLGLLINSVALNNIGYIPLVSLGISVIFTIFKMIPFLNKKIYIYIIPYILTIIIGCILNSKIYVFDFDIVWVIYIVLIEILFSVYTLCRIRKKYSFLRRK